MDYYGLLRRHHQLTASRGFRCVSARAVLNFDTAPSIQIQQLEKGPGIPNVQALGRATLPRKKFTVIQVMKGTQRLVYGTYTKGDVPKDDAGIPLFIYPQMIMFSGMMHLPCVHIDPSAIAASSKQTTNEQGR